jgi:poly-gamma-glutamate synthesis protein (capsule biosynthesis protein)
VKRAALIACILLVSACNSEAISEPTTTVPEEVSITMAFVGDVLPHSPLVTQARRNATRVGNPDGFDFSPMFADITPLISQADLAICHLETPIAPQGEALSTFPFFGVPPEITNALAESGFDRCSTASNHTYDRGLTGIDTTVNALQDQGIAQSGMARTPDEIEPSVFELRGVVMSHLSYTFSYNGLTLPQDQQWRSALINTDRILRDAKKARQLGAQVVIVSMHWGNEMSHQLNSQQTSVAKALTASGDVDLIVGHHAHVVQPIEQVNGVWVMYGMGNVLSNLPTDERWPASSQDAGIFTTTLRVQPNGSMSFDQPVVHPTWVDKDNDWVIRNITENLRNNTPGINTNELEQSLRRTARVLGEFITP